jgi:hypothetical protein
VRAVALVLVACLLAACGKGSDAKAPATAATRAETAYLTQMQSLCVRAAQGDAGVPNLDVQRITRMFDRYGSFVRSLKRVQAPQRFAADHRLSVGIEQRMLRTVEALRPSLRGADRVALASAFDLARQAYGRNDTIDARLGLLDCIWPPRTTLPTDAYPPVTKASLAKLTPHLDRVCVDNASRTAYARTLIARDVALGREAARAARSRVAEASAERLPRLLRRVPRPTDAPARYGGWLDALTTVGNFLRLAAATNDGKRADALRAQAGRTAAAARQTARELGLPDCAKGDAAAEPSATAP